MRGKAFRDFVTYDFGEDEFLVRSKNGNPNYYASYRSAVEGQSKFFGNAVLGLFIVFFGISLFLPYKWMGIEGTASFGEKLMTYAAAALMVSICAFVFTLLCRALARCIQIIRKRFSPWWIVAALAAAAVLRCVIF